MAEGNKEKESLGYRIALGGMKGILRMLILIALLVVLIFLGRTAYSLGFEVFNQQPVDAKPGRAVTVEIGDDLSVRQIGKLLSAKGLINESASAFVVQELLSGYHGELLPGTYTLRTSMTVDEMFPILAQDMEEAEAGL